MSKSLAQGGKKERPDPVPFLGRGRLSLVAPATCLAQRLPPDSGLRIPPRQLQAADPTPAPAASGVPASTDGEAPFVLQAMWRRAHLDCDPVPAESQTAG